MRLFCEITIYVSSVSNSESICTAIFILLLFLILFFFLLIAAPRYIVVCYKSEFAKLNRLSYPDCHWSTISEIRRAAKENSVKMEIINQQHHNARGGVWKMRQNTAYGKQWQNNEKCKRNMVTKRIEMEKKWSNKTRQKRATAFCSNTFIQC